MTGGEHLNQPCPHSPPSVHPRTGGEHSLADDTVELLQDAGSSPHGRGTLSATRTYEHCCAMRRFIPARAGNTLTRTRSSSPDRFIPARAGNTRRRAANCR